MKLLPFILLSVGILFMGFGRANSQCNSADYSQKCISKVQDGFTFLKSFNIDSQNGNKQKVEYSYVFSKDTQYFLNVCADGNDNGGIILTIYDSNRKVASTNHINGKLFPAIIFDCKSTGIYYISYTFENSSESCGGSVLAFRR